MCVFHNLMPNWCLDLIGRYSWCSSTEWVFFQWLPGRFLLTSSPQLQRLTTVEKKHVCCLPGTYYGCGFHCFDTGLIFAVGLANEFSGLRCFSSMQSTYSVHLLKYLPHGFLQWQGFRLLVQGPFQTCALVFSYKMARNWMILTVPLVLPQTSWRTLELALVHTTCLSSSLFTRYLCHI